MFCFLKLKKVILISGIAILIILFLRVFYLSENSEDVKNIYVNSDAITYEILVDVEESKLYLLEDDICKKVYNCAGGKQSTPSPIGTWKIISKGNWGEGFGGSWLGVDVPWGEFGIHGTTEKYSVGWASSHGCIRMNNAEVKELYKIIPIGTKVTIIDGVYREFGKGFRDLKSGMYGSDVKAIQEKLNELGFFQGIPNGKFGAATEKAIIEYCKANGIWIRKIIDIELQKQLGFELID